MKMAHTPGPWKITNAQSHTLIDSAGGFTIASMTQPISPETEANARLIAASPALLSALELLINTGFPTQDEYGKRHWAVSESQLDIARAAIERVES